MSVVIDRLDYAFDDSDITVRRTEVAGKRDYSITSVSQAFHRLGMTRRTSRYELAELSAPDDRTIKPLL